MTTAHPHPTDPSAQANSPEYGSFNASQSTGYGFKAFGSSWGAWLGAQLLFGLLIIALLSASLVAAGDWTFSATGEELEPSTAQLTVFIVGVVLILVLITVFQLIMARNAAIQVRTGQIFLRDFIRLDRLGKPFLMLSLFTAAWVTTAVLVVHFSSPSFVYLHMATFMCIALFYPFAMAAAVSEPDLGFGAMIAAAWRVASGNVGQSVVLVLIYLGLTLVAGIIIPLALVFYPACFLMFAHAHLTSARLPVFPRP